MLIYIKCFTFNLFLHIKCKTFSDPSQWLKRLPICIFKYILCKFLTLSHNYLWLSVQFSSFAQSCPTLWPHESQNARRPLCPPPTPGVHSDSCPSSWWCHPAISSSVIPFSSCPNPSQYQGLFQWVNSLHEVAKVLEFQLQHQSFQRNPRTDLL